MRHSRLNIKFSRMSGQWPVLYWTGSLGISLLEMLIAMSLVSFVFVTLMASVVMLLRINHQNEQKVKIYRELLWIHSLIRQGQRSHAYTGCSPKYLNDDSRQSGHSCITDSFHQSIRFDRKSIGKLFHIRIMGQILMFYHFSPMAHTTSHVDVGQKKISITGSKGFNAVLDGSQSRSKQEYRAGRITDEIILRDCNNEMKNRIARSDSSEIFLEIPLDKTLSVGTEIGVLITDYYFLAEKDNYAKEPIFYHVQKVQNKMSLYPLSKNIMQFLVSEDRSHATLITKSIQLWNKNNFQEKQWTINLDITDSLALVL